MENNLDDNSEMRNKSEIKFLEFLDEVGYDNERREKVLLFRVYFLNGKSELIDKHRYKKSGSTCLDEILLKPD
jgi:hypothetical protein